MEHPWFRAAQADPAAPTARYFVFHEHPDDYESWLGVASLPKLDYRSAGLRAAMYDGPDAVLRRWLRPPYAVDGWRIDVANMLGRLGPDQLGPDVARGMRRAVKAEQPDAYLLGEHAYDATDHLAGDQWDGVMDYWGFQRPSSTGSSAVELWSARDRTRRPRRALVDRGPRRHDDRVPGGDPVGRGPPPAGPPRQPRHPAHPDRP